MLCKRLGHFCRIFFRNCHIRFLESRKMYCHYTHMRIARSLLFLTIVRPPFPPDTKQIWIHFSASLRFAHFTFLWKGNFGKIFGEITVDDFASSYYIYCLNLKFAIFTNLKLKVFKKKYSTKLTVIIGLKLISEWEHPFHNIRSWQSAQNFFLLREDFLTEALTLLQSTNREQT